MAGADGAADRYADRDDLAIVLERHPVRTLAAPEVGRLPAVAGEARVEGAVRVVAGEGEVAEAGLGAASRNDLAVALQRHPGRPVDVPTEVGRLPAVAGEARVERAVGVVAGEREVEPGHCRRSRPRRSCRRPGAPPRSPRRIRPRNQSSVCRRRRSSYRAVRLGCSGRVRSPRPSPKPTATILPLAWSATPLAPSLGAEVGPLLAVAREARVERAVGVVAGEREIRAAGAVHEAHRDDLAVRSGAPPPLPRRRVRSRSSACRRHRSSCRASRRGCSGRARSQARGC